MYWNDINVLGEEFDDILTNLVEVLTRFHQYGLKLKPYKCELFTQEVKLFGHKVHLNGIHLTGDHIKAVLEWPIPTCRKEFESFLGFVNYHHSFITGPAGRVTIFMSWQVLQRRNGHGIRIIPRHLRSWKKQWLVPLLWLFQILKIISFWIPMHHI